ncbi:hypothetical protein SAMN05216344_106137 [Polaromonas sp. OV174]|uniref:hypothetical protein n=1 Tax=Polaromonas sp. OV174 TaxID=1855300 RepID=UPI0008EC6FF7|nr:hypothetical protein [Polaromonas sp. OV174]SFB96976.1 hypothetical protein SAMN05216344_106137 [Polaromonas sp. OV174]
MIAKLLLVLFQVHALALLMSCFCRLAKTSKANTLPSVRWVFTGLSIVSAWCAAAPWLFAYRPDLISTALVCAITYTQIVTSHHWRRGVPHQFLKESKE